MRGSVRWGFARSTYSPLKVGKFWRKTQSIWTVDQGWPRRRRPGCAVSSPRSTPTMPRCRRARRNWSTCFSPRSTQTVPCGHARRNWSTCFSPRLPPTSVKPWTGPAEDLRRARLIADVFADFERLLAEPKRSPVAGDAWLAPASLIQRRIAMAKSSATRKPRSQEAEKGKAQARGDRPDVVRAQPPEIDGDEGRSRQEEIAGRNATWIPCDHRETVRNRRDSIIIVGEVTCCLVPTTHWP